MWDLQWYAHNCAFTIQVSVSKCPKLVGQTPSVMMRFIFVFEKMELEMIKKSKWNWINHNLKVSSRRYRSSISGLLEPSDDWSQRSAWEYVAKNCPWRKQSLARELSNVKALKVNQVRGFCLWMPNASKWSKGQYKW